MLYFLSEDDMYYGVKGHDLIIAMYPDVEQIVKWPTSTDLAEIGKKDVSKVAFLAPYLPAKMHGVNLSQTMYFEVVRLPNKHGILTSGQVRLKRTEAEVLEEKLGVGISTSDLRMINYGGAAKLHEQVEIIRQKFRHKEATKGFLLTGIPGTGKSFFAKCLAGELGYLLVSLNLSVFMEKDDTVYAINEFFKFFENTPGKYILWIDEIEKMFTSDKAQQVMGALLTNINESNNMSDTSSFFIVATANNVSAIAETNPEFFRNGRFDAIIFLLNPVEEDAVGIFELYISKQRKKLRQSLVPMALKIYSSERGDCLTRSERMGRQIFGRMDTHDQEKLLTMTDSEAIAFCNTDTTMKRLIALTCDENEFCFDTEEFMMLSSGQHRQESSQKSRYVYTPAEIEFIIQDSFHGYYLLGHPSMDYTKMLEKYKPLQTTIKDGIREILAKASSFMEI